MLKRSNNSPAVQKKNYTLAFFVALSSLGFYNPMNIISPQMQKLLFYAICSFVFCYTYINGISLKRKQFPKLEYAVLLSSILFSIFIVYLYQDQSLFISIQATLPFIFAYAFLFILLKMNLPLQRVESMLIVFGMIEILVNGINHLTFPNNFFGGSVEEIDTSRGIARVRGGIICTCFLFFYSLSQIKNSRKALWRVLALLSYFFIILSVTRQYIAYTTLFGGLFLLSRTSWQKKILFGTIMLVLIRISMEIPMIKAMIELSADQKDDNEVNEDIRLVAYAMYLFEFQRNEITQIFGNGVPSLGNSAWGIEFENMTDILHTYAADIGWGGFYFHFGLLGTIALFVIFIKAICKRYQEQYKYISYLLVVFLLTNFTSGSIFYRYEIIFLMFYFYIAFSAPSTNGCLVTLKEKTGNRIINKTLK